MRRLKLFTLLIGPYIKRYRLPISFLLFLMLLIYFLTPFLSKTFFKPAISQGVIGTYTEDELPLVITSLLSEGLIKLDPSGKPLPNLASSWESNAEATLYTFKLKEDLHWADGTKVRSFDISILVPDVEFITPDDNTIALKLKDPFSPLPTLLTKPILKKSTSLGIGPYKIEKIEKSQIFLSKVVLVSNRQDLPKVTIRFYPNERIAKDALKLGEVQSLLGVSSPTELTSQKAYALWNDTNYQKLVAVFYNTKDPYLSDKNFRIALSYAAPVIAGEVEAKTSIPPTSWAFNKSAKDYLDNNEQAVEHLAKVEKGKEEQLTLTTVESLKDVGTKIVASWNNLGLNAVLRVESGVPQNFQALLISQNIPADPDQYSLWHSTQVNTNITKYSSEVSNLSARIDKNLEDGRKNLEEEKRIVNYQDFQRVLLDDAPATFLYFPKYNVVYLKKIEEPLKKVLELQTPEIYSK